MQKQELTTEDWEKIKSIQYALDMIGFDLDKPWRLKLWVGRNKEKRIYYNDEFERSTIIYYHSGRPNKPPECIEFLTCANRQYKNQELSINRQEQTRRLFRELARNWAILNIDKAILLNNALPNQEHIDRYIEAVKELNYENN